MNGILVLDKPSSLSSARAVGHIKRLLPRKTKIGHAGTLDPFATGVLLLLVGRATKLCEKIMDLPKQYSATVAFGSTTATDDPESEPRPWPGMTANTPLPQIQDIDNILPRFTGQVMQTPPIFSALKIKGRRAYQLARSGAVPVMVPRPVMIYGIRPVEYTWPLLKLSVDCGRGTYIRALARDIGAALNVGGHLTELRRTRIGPFALESSVSLASPDSGQLHSGQLDLGQLAEKLIPIEQAITMI
jgi:tRNA pseudouridine55 synthase